MSGVHRSCLGPSRRLVILSVALWALFSYFPGSGLFWLAPLGTFLLLSTAFFADGKKAFEWLGIPSRRGVVWSVMLFPLFLGASWLVQSRVCAEQRLVYESHASQGYAVWYLHTLGQVVSEELVLGGLLLFSVERWLRGAPRWLLASGIAAVFALLHLALYAWSPWAASEHRILSWSSLLALFLVGLIRNLSILEFRHVGIATSLHLGWNLLFFGGGFRHGEGGGLLSEVERFERILGSAQMVGLLGVSAAVLVGTLSLRRRERLSEPTLPG